VAGQEKKKLKLPQRDLGAVLEKRLYKLHAKLKKNSLDAFIVSATPNRYYLSGWNGDSESGWVVVTLDKSYILTDSRYTEHATGEAPGFEITEYEASLPEFFGEFSAKLNLKRVGFESHDLSVFNLRRLRRFTKHLKLVPVAHLIEDLRTVKDQVEIENIASAVRIADTAFDYILNFVKPGKTEVEIAWEMEKFMRDAGAEKMAWDPFIVASGQNSSMAHWGASEEKIKKNDMVLVDYGCVVGGYYSDTSRVFFVGRPTTEQKKVYNLVLDAQKLGESLVKEGARGSTIDKKVRSFLEKNLPAGRQAQNIYRHSLGHGVGLEIHELPRLSIHSKNKLQYCNVLTVEPGVYIPGWGGVRLEDVVVVEKEGCRVLTKASKDIKEVTI